MRFPLRHFWSAAAIVVALMLAVSASAGEVARADLDILGLALEVDRSPVTTAVDIPAFVQTKFGGKSGDQAPLTPGLSAIGELTGPGIDAPITLVTAPGRPFALPALHEKGEYALQNIRLVGAAGQFLQQAIPSFAIINVTDVLKTEIRVRQLTAEELRERGIIVDSRNFEVYEYTFVFAIDQGQRVEIPYPVIIDKRTREVIAVPRESPYTLPPIPQSQRPPRFEPPAVAPFQMISFEEPDGGSNPPGGDDRRQRPSIPAALVIPNGFGVLHQFFAVILQVQNAAPDGSNIEIGAISATINAPSQLRVARVTPAVTIGQPVPIVDEKTGATFLVAGARGTSEWTVEALKAGTHTVDVDVRATFRKPGQADVPMRGRVSASLVVTDPRFHINFSHPDTVRKDEKYTAYTFVTNLSSQRQHVVLDTSLIPPCTSGASFENVCRQEGETNVALDLDPGEMKAVPYRMLSKITGRVFATAGVANDEAIGASVKLTMGVSASGIPLSPATLVLPFYAQYLSSEFIDANLQLLGLGYSLATAPLNQHTAKFPRVLKTDVFQRAQQIARAGQRVFITRRAGDVNDPAENREAFFHLALDLLGNIERLDQIDTAPLLEEWDALRRVEGSGRRAEAAMARQLEINGFSVDAFAAATSHRTPFLFAYAHGAAGSGSARPYALSVKALTSGGTLDVPAEADSGWTRTLPYSQLTQLNANGDAGEFALVGRWREEDFRIRVIPAASTFKLHLIYPDTVNGTQLRTDIDITSATPGAPVEITLRRGARTLIVNGATAMPLVNPVPQTEPRLLGAAQDLHLDDKGHLVSLLFNRPLAVADPKTLRDRFALTVNVAKASYSVRRRNSAARLEIPGAALQEDAKIINVSFDKTLSRNATYIIAADALKDLVTASVFSRDDVVPRIDNDRPGGILTGKVLRADNTPVPGLLVQLTSAYEGNAVGEQFDIGGSDGRYLFEFVPRDLDRGITGAYSLRTSDGAKLAAVDGSVRLSGEVHTVNLVFLGRGRAQGQVRYSDGEIVPNIEVTIGSSMFAQARHGFTDAGGNYDIGDLPVGPLTFSVVDKDGRPTFAANQIRTAGEVVTQDLVIVRKEPPGTGTVRITVRRSDTTAVIAGALVGVWQQGYVLRDGHTGTDGTFTFTNVPAGTVSMLAADFSISRHGAGVEAELRKDQTLEQTLVISVPVPNVQYATLEGIVMRDDPAAPGNTTKDQIAAGAIVTVDRMPPVTANADGAYLVPDLPLDASGRQITVFDPATGRRGFFAMPTLVAGSNRFTMRLKSTQPAGIATMRARVYGPQGEPVSGYRVIWPGFPPQEFAAKGSGVYELGGMRVPLRIDLAAVPADTNGPWGDQVAFGSVRVDFHGQVGVTDLRLPGSGTVVVRLEIETPCGTPPCYTQLTGPVSLSYSVWDEVEQSMTGRTLERAPDPTSGLVTFTKIPARQNLSIATVRNPAGYASVNASLSHDADVVNVTLRLKTIGDVSGRVLAYDGVTPVSGATVRIETNSATYAPAITNPDGTFRFIGIPAATDFAVIADLHRDGVYRAGIAGGRTPQGGGPVANLLIRLREQSTVEGRILDAGNAAVPLARFWLRELAWPYRWSGTPHDPLQADINGRFVVSNVFTGEFRMTAVHPTNQELRGDYQGALSQEGDASQRNVQVHIGADGVGSISVTVTDPLLGFIPVANAEVAVYRGSSRFDFATTNDNGVAFFDGLPAGSRYWVTAYSKKVGRGGGVGEFTVSNRQTSSVTVHLEFRGLVSGTLTDPESEPTPGLPVRGMPVRLQTQSLDTAASTDVNGAFEFLGVPEGRVYLSAIAIGTNRTAKGPDGLFIDRLVPERKDIRLELERTATLTMRVFLPNDTGGPGQLAPLTEVTVWQLITIYDPPEYYRGQQGNPSVFRKMRRGGNYGFEVRELGGENRVVRGGGYFAGDSYTAEHNIVLPTSGTVEVRVVDAAGKPVEDARVEIFAPNVGQRTLYTPASGMVMLPGVPLGWITAQATKGNVAASAGGQLFSRSQPLQLTLNLGTTATVEGGVDAETGFGQPSAGTRVLMTVNTRLLPQPMRLETLTDASGAYRFTGIPVGGTSLALSFYGPDDTTVGATRSVSIADGTTGVVTIPRVKIDATPPRVLTIDPPANATSVSPGSVITVTFSEQIAAGYLNRDWFQLLATDNGSHVASTIEPSVRPDGTLIVKIIPPPPPPGQKFPLRSNVLYRLTIPAGIQDVTGNAMSVVVGSSFTTVNYTEPSIVRVDPPENLPIPAGTTFRIRFNKPIDITSFEPGHGGLLTLEQLGSYKGAAIATVPISKYVDVSDPSTLVVAPQGVAIAESSFYRITISGTRDLQTPPNVQKDPRVIEYASFDTKRPLAKIVSPVAAGESLVSELLYTATVNVTDEVTNAESTDVAYVDWLDGNGTAIARVNTKPFRYGFVAPATSTGTTFTLKASAVDLSGNASPSPDTITWNVAPNLAPRDLVVTNTPQAEYPTHGVQTRVHLKDEGLTVNVSIELRGTRTDGSELRQVMGATNITRASTSAEFPEAVFHFTLPETLRDGAAKVVLTATDSVNKSAVAEAPITILADTTPPQFVSFTPRAETHFQFNQTYTIQLRVRDVETGVARAVFTVNGREELNSSNGSYDASTGITTFTKNILVPPKNADTRIAIVATAYDKRNNTFSETHEVIYDRVNDQTLPKAVWITPLDGAALPANQPGWLATLRVRASDDSRVTAVRFESTALAAPVTLENPKSGTTDIFEAKTALNFPADKSPFVIKAIVSDGDPAHDVELPITIDPVDVHIFIDADINISSITADQYANRSVLVRGPARVFISVPITLKDLMLVDATELGNPEETRLDVTITDHLFIDGDSRVNVNAKGYLGGRRSRGDNSFQNPSTTGRTLGGTTDGGAVMADASHGGFGGSYLGKTNASYGSITVPADFGSGGSAPTPGHIGGNGGGAIALRGGGGLARFVFAGWLWANGDTLASSGSGGSILIDARAVIASPLTRIAANGGDAGGSDAHDLGGGGGRVAIRASERLDLDPAIVQARGGRHGLLNNGGEGPFFVDGGAGTFYLKRPGAALGELIVTSFDERFPATTHRSAATPLAGTLAFDAITIGPRALARFDLPTSIPMTVDPTATVVMPTDVPAITLASTTPAAGDNVVQNTSIVSQFNASSAVGIREVRTILSAQPNDVVSYARWPVTLTGSSSTILVPQNAPTGAATLKVRVTDRAGRVAESTPVSFNIINNAPAVIQTFDVTPATETFANRSITVSATASDDIEVKSLTLASSIGTVTAATATKPTPTTMARTFTVAIPANTPSNSDIVLTLSALDDVQGRIATTATHTVKVKKDAIAPAITIVKPAPNEQIQEAAGATFVVEVNVVDAEVAVGRVTVTFEGTESDLTFVSGNLWRRTLNVPSVDGSEPVAKSLTIRATDYDANTSSAVQAFFVKPLLDPNAPALQWVCASPGALYPPGYEITLRVSATPSSPANGVSSVAVTVDGNALTVTSAGSNVYEAKYTISGAATDGTGFSIRAVATSVSGNESTLLGTITAIVPGPDVVDIRTQSIIQTNDTAYENKSVIVREGGRLIVNGPHHLGRIAVLHGGVIAQNHVDISSAADVLTLDRLFLACGASFDASASGYPRNTAYPGSATPLDSSGGGHIGRGNVWSPPGGSTYGSIYRPRERGGGGHTIDPNYPTWGGGVIRLDAAALIVDGAIRANGIDNATWGPGAGGSVWITTQALGGGGAIEARGGGESNDRGGAGGGAIAIEYGTMSGAVASKLVARGGRTSSNRPGGAGSIYLKGPQSVFGDLIIDNGGQNGALTELPWLGTYTVAAVKGTTATLAERAYIQKFQAGNWVRVVAPDGTVRGTWRIASVANDPNAATPPYAVYFATDAANDEGYLIYSEIGYGPLSKKLVAVKYENGQWLYDNDDNNPFTPFTPNPSDRVIAKFRRANGGIYALERLACAATCGSINGIPIAELASGDIHSNSFGGTYSNEVLWQGREMGEFLFAFDADDRSLAIVQSAPQITLESTPPNPVVLHPGDQLRGVYRFDRVIVRGNAAVITRDAVESATAPLVAAGASFAPGDPSSPAVDASKIAIVRGLAGFLLVGQAGAVSDPDGKVDIIARNAARPQPPRLPQMSDGNGAAATRYAGALRIRKISNGDQWGSIFLTQPAGSGVAYVTFTVGAVGKVGGVGIASQLFHFPAHGTWEIWPDVQWSRSGYKAGSMTSSTLFRLEKTPDAVRWYVDDALIHEYKLVVSPSARFEFAWRDDGAAWDFVDSWSDDLGMHSNAAAADGSFSVPLSGKPGDPVMLTARDRHRWRQSTGEIAVGSIPSGFGIASVTFDGGAIGGRSTSGTVTLRSAAGAGGALVLLSTTSTDVTIPVSITIPAAATSATFTVQTKPVLAPSSATITATWGGEPVSGTLQIARDNVPPGVTVAAPAANTQYTEGRQFTVQATATDADSGVKRVFAVIDGKSYDLASQGANVYTGQVQVPFIDGSQTVTRDLVVRAEDNTGNVGSSSAVPLTIHPVVETTVPTIRWSCGGVSMFPVAYVAKLRVIAKAPNATNVLHKVELTFNGATVEATAIGGDIFEVAVPVPDAADGTVLPARFVATTASGTTAIIDGTLTILKGATEIATNTTIASNDTSKDNKTIVVFDGVTLTIAGAHPFDRFVVLPNAKVVHAAAASATSTERVDITASAMFIACGGSIDASGGGFAGGVTYPGASATAGNSGASHIGRGNNTTSPTVTYGSIFRPLEHGAGDSAGTRGGGVIKLTVTNLAVDGAVRANGANYTGTAVTGAGGAGGSVWIRAGRISGAGSLEADGGYGCGYSSSGGAVAIETTDASSVRPLAFARGGLNAGICFNEPPHFSSPGSVYYKGPLATYGELSIDSASRGTGVVYVQGIGRGVALTGSAGATLITDRAADVPQYFVGHWVRITAPNGTVKGVWRVASIAQKTLTLEAGASAPNVAAGDLWSGLYLFDKLSIRGNSLESVDPVEATDWSIEGDVSLSRVIGTNLVVHPNAALHPFTGSPLVIVTANETRVAANGAIDATGRGYANTSTYPGARAATGNEGGSHIGRGGNVTAANSTYGSVIHPEEMGGGDGTSVRGGGAIRIDTASLIVDGAVRANGAAYDGTALAGAGGAGGSVRIKTNAINGAGAISADGGSGCGAGAGGGAVAIEYTTSTTLPQLFARGGNAACGDVRYPGAPGTIFVKTPPSTYGNLTIDRASGGDGTMTELPSLGNGTAQSGSSGATLVTDRAADVPAYFTGHWVEIRGATGILKGVWRIVTISGRSVTLVPNASETIAIAAGDLWRGVYRFDTITLRTARLRSLDAVRYTTLDKDAGSTFTSNDGAPLFAQDKLAQIVLESTPAADSVIAPAGTISDPDTPVIMTATNLRTAVPYTANAAADGSFRVTVAGAAGDTFTVKATDSHALPLSSPTLPVGGQITERNEVASLSLNSTTVAGGTSVMATLRLTAPARTGGALIALSSSNAAAFVSSTITVPAGASAMQFTITTTAPPSAVAAVITATSVVSVTATLNVLPPSATLVSLILSPTTIEGGAGVDATVTLGAPAPAGGAIVTLLSNTPHVRVPASVQVPAGSTQATFGVATSRVTAATTGTITASYGSTRTATLTITACTTPMELAARPSSTALDSMWVDDTAPAGATGAATFDATQVASGSLALHFAAGTGTRTWSFSGATPISAGPADNLVLHALVNPCNPPRQILVTWSDGTSQWRASWGESRIDNSVAQLSAGAIPGGAAGLQPAVWTRLNVVARRLGISTNKNLTALTIAVDGGEAWFDAIGATACTLSTAPRPQYLQGEAIWFDDAIPAGAVPGPTPFQWDTSQVASGTVADVLSGPAQVEHLFTGAAGLPLAMDDLLFAYVLIDPCNPPRELMLQWNDGTNWNRRAFWGEDLIEDGTIQSVERKRIAAVPESGRWVRLEVPVSSMKMAGFTLRGMSFSVYGGRAWFDRVGKVSRVNLALGKPATHSSLHQNNPDWVPGKSNDGDVTNLSHTNNELQAWWQVDLGAVQPIDTIDVWNVSCCASEQSRLSNFYVLVSDEPLTSTDLTIAVSQPGVSAYYHLAPADRPTAFEIRRTGRYVRVQLAGASWLHPAEVQVWGPVSPVASNVAGGRGATQSSTLADGNGPYRAELAVNGSVAPVNLSHTQNQSEAWWEADLKSVQPIDAIDIDNDHGPGSSVTGRMANFYVFVSDVPFTSTSVAPTLAQSEVSAYYRSTPSTSQTYAIRRSGRYVRVQLTGTNWLHPLEVRMLSSSSPSSNSAPLFPTNLRSQIVVAANASGDFVTGPAGAVTDPDTPVRMIATNTRTGQRFTAFALANGSFSVPVIGAAGDAFTLRAEDSHPHSLISMAIPVNGVLVQASGIASVTIAPSSVDGGAAAMATVRLDSPAAAAMTVPLASSTTFATVPASIVINEGSSAAQFVITTTSPAAVANATITATYRNAKSAALTIVPASAALTSLTLGSASIEGGVSVNGTVALSAAAPAGGALVMLATSDSTRAAVPSSVLVAAGTTSAIFTITTTRVAATTNATITATYGATKQASLALTPCASLAHVTPPAFTAPSTVWFDDAPPAGATPTGAAAFENTQFASGTRSLHFAAATGAREWSFTGAPALAVGPNDSIVFHLLVHPCNPPRQILAAWSDGTTESRRSWGEGLIDITIPHTLGGAAGLQPAGTWTRIEVTAKSLGITATRNLTRLTLKVHGGEAWFDLMGVTACNLPVAAAPAFDDNEIVWFDDALPPGAVAQQTWTWTSAQIASGSASVLNPLASGGHQLSFTGAQPLATKQGDMLFAYVLLDPCNPPRQLMLAFNNDRRAYWGDDLLFPDTTDSPANVRMGPLPEAGKWVRLEVPVSFLGLDGANLNGMAMTLYDGQAWFDRAGKYARVNVAYRKTATQSSTEFGLIAAHAVDGNTATINHTVFQSQPWLLIDLGSVQPIEHIQIWNRVDNPCCVDRLRDHYLFVSDEPFTSNDIGITTAQAGVSRFRWVGSPSPVITYTINRTGRYIRLQLGLSNNLNIAELQVWAPAASKRANLAGGRVAVASSEFDGWTRSNNAVDGHYNSSYQTGASLAATAIQSEPWWEVDLGSVAPIASIDLLNRVESIYRYQLTDFYVFVSGTPFTATTIAGSLAQPGVSAFYFGPPQAMNYVLPLNRTGRYVRVQRRATDLLSISEIHVWSLPSVLGALSKPEEER